MIPDTIAYHLQVRHYMLRHLRTWSFLGAYETIEDAHQAGKRAQQSRPAWEFRVISPDCEVVDAHPSPQE